MEKVEPVSLSLNSLSYFLLVFMGRKVKINLLNSLSGFLGYDQNQDYRRFKTLHNTQLNTTKSAIYALTLPRFVANLSIYFNKLNLIIMKKPEL